MDDALPDLILVELHPHWFFLLAELFRVLRFLGASHMVLIPSSKPFNSALYVWFSSLYLTWQAPSTRVSVRFGALAKVGRLNTTCQVCFVLGRLIFGQFAGESTIFLSILDYIHRLEVHWIIVVSWTYFIWFVSFACHFIWSFVSIHTHRLG